MTGPERDRLIGEAQELARHLRQVYPAWPDAAQVVDGLLAEVTRLVDAGYETGNMVLHLESEVTRLADELADARRWAEHLRTEWVDLADSEGVAIVGSTRLPWETAT